MEYAHATINSIARFANYRTWLGSDYMLGQLTLDPTVAQKRLGDGFYEQRLINEQIAQLTGQRFLGNYTSEETQYKALMDAGITYAAALNLRPGIALTAVQMAQLTSDIVWLVEQTVTLPDGSTQRVLVPQVYVRVQAGDLDGAGTLLAGREINLNVNGDLTNTGTVAGRTVMALTAENIHNLGGRISGNAVAITARTDLNNIGGQIDAANTLSVAAGRDLNIASTTTALTTTGSTVGPTVSTFSGIDRVAGLYITNPGGTLLASAGRDMNLVAGIIQSQGSAQLQAGNNLNLSTVTQTDSVDATRDERNYTRWSQTQDIGSQVSATGNVSLVAGKDINATAAGITSEQGALVASAGNNVNLKEGRKETSLATARPAKPAATKPKRSSSNRASPSASATPSSAPWKPASRWQARPAIRIDTAVKPQWINPLTGELAGSSPVNTVYAIKIPAGTTVYAGPVANQGGVYVGGQNISQIFVPEPWKLSGVTVIGLPTPLR
jgi:filamentous hemagglutinin